MARLPVVLQRVPRLLVSVRTLETRSPAAHLIDRFSAGAVDRFTAVSEAARQVIANPTPGRTTNVARSLVP